VGGVLYLPMWLVNSVPQAMGVATSYTLFTAGMNSVSGALMGTAVPREKHGRAFGVLQSFQSMAWGLGPLLGGSIARSLGLREVFPINGLALILLGILAWRFVSLTGAQGKPSSEQPTAAGGLRPQGQNLR